MRFSLLFLFITLIGIPLAAQNTAIDSLRSVVDGAKSDTARIRAQIALAEALTNVDAEEALTIGKRAIEGVNDLRFTDAVGPANLTVGLIYMQLGMLDIAAEYFLHAFEGYEKAGKKKKTGTALSYLAYANFEIKDFESALRYFRQAGDIYREVGHEEALLYNRNNIATTYMEMKQTDTAEAWFMRNLANPLMADNPELEAATYHNLGEVEVARKAYRTAIDYYDRALAIRLQEGESREQLSLSQANLAEALIGAGEYGRARVVLDSAFAAARSVSAYSRLMTAYQVEALLFEKQGDFQAAYGAQKRYQQLRDSLFNTNQANKIATLQTGFETERNLAEIDFLNRQGELQTENITFQRILSVLLALAAAGLLGLLIVVMRKNKSNREDKEKLQVKNHEIEEKNIHIQKQNESLQDLIREKDGIIGVVAHDLKSPLAKAQSLAEILAGEGNLSKSQEQYLSMIRMVCEDGGAMIQDLLDIARYEQMETPVQIEQVDANAFAGRVVETFAPQADAKKIGLHFQASKTPVRLPTDPGMLSRILDNLVSNALKFTHPGKNVSLDVQSRNGWVIFSVKDEGQGIQASERGDVFKKFQKLSARPTAGESSNGLGLSIVHTLVNRLSGKIDFSSEPGAGTTFRVFLPAGDSA